MEHNPQQLLLALWDGEDEGREARVVGALDELQLSEAHRQIVLTKVLPVIPELKRRKNECGGAYDVVIEFRGLLSEVINGKTRFPSTVEDLVAEIARRVENSYE